MFYISPGYSTAPTQHNSPTLWFFHFVSPPFKAHLFIRVFLIWLCFCQWIPSVPPTANATHSARRPPLLAYVETASQISMLGKLWAVHRCLFRFILVSLSLYTTQTFQWRGEINATPEMNCKPAVS